jgi:hypothetical protein
VIPTTFGRQAVNHPNQNKKVQDLISPNAPMSKAYQILDSITGKGRTRRPASALSIVLVSSISKNYTGGLNCLCVSSRIPQLCPDMRLPYEINMVES